MTYSISGWCPVTRQVGFAMASFDITFASPAELPSSVLADTGSVACQAMTRPGFGGKVAQLLARGVPAAKALGEALQDEPARELFQVCVVDRAGAVAAFTGESTMEWSGHVTGTHCVAAGNLLEGGQVVAAMVAKFEARRDDDLPERLLAALRAGQRAGGDRRGTRSATLRVAATDADELYLRVQHHRRPVAELKRLLRLADVEVDFAAAVRAASDILAPLLREQDLVAELSSLTTVTAVERLRHDSRAQALLSTSGEGPLDLLILSLERTHSSLGQVPFRVTMSALAAGLFGPRGRAVPGADGGSARESNPPDDAQAPSQPF